MICVVFCVQLEQNGVTKENTVFYVSHLFILIMVHVYQHTQ